MTTTVRIGAEVQRRIAVKGRCGVDATVLVVARQGKVWLSVDSPFTDEAIMPSATVDEVVRALQLAQHDAVSAQRDRSS